MEHQQGRATGLVRRTTTRSAKSPICSPRGVAVPTYLVYDRLPKGCHYRQRPTLAGEQIGAGLAGLAHLQLL